MCIFGYHNTQSNIANFILQSQEWETMKWLDSSSKLFRLNLNLLLRKATSFASYFILILPNLIICIKLNFRVQVSRVGNREVARFQLQLAPRHVITPQHKKDILKNAFRLQRPSKEQSSKILSKDKSKSKSLLLSLENHQGLL